MKVKIKLDPAAMKKLNATVLQALEMTAAATKTDIETSKVVPKNIGELERSGFVDRTQLAQGKVAIVYDTPYARRLYWNPQYNFRQDKNPNARGRWMDAYIDGDKKNFIPNTFKKFLRQLSGGLIK